MRTTAPSSNSSSNHDELKTRWWSDSPLEKYWMEIAIDSWGNKLVAPEHSRHAIMHDVQVDDVVFHWVGKNNTRALAPGLYGYSRVAGELKRDSGIWKDEKANEIELTDYVAFSSPIYLEEIRKYSTRILDVLESLRESTRKTTYFPFQEHKGFGVKPNQRYLTKFPLDLVKALPRLEFPASSKTPATDPKQKAMAQVNLTVGIFEPDLENTLAASAFDQTVRHYENKGYTVETAAEGLPYDFVASRQGDERHLVVTWSHEEIEKFNVDRTVCEHAQAFQQTDLVLISSIPWNRHSDVNITTGQGHISVQSHWLPDTDRLRPLIFEYSIDESFTE